MPRPRKTIDPEHVEALARIGCTYNEIAAVLKCGPDVLQRRFAAVVRRGHEQARVSLRRAQFAKALEGNPTMLIWLGKQWLGQRDRHDHQLSGTGEGGAIAQEVVVRFVAPSGAIVSRSSHDDEGDEPLTQAALLAATSGAADEVKLDLKGLQEILPPTLAGGSNEAIAIPGVEPHRPAGADRPLPSPRSSGARNTNGRLG